jgi:hypothetical protein
MQNAGPVTKRLLLAVMFALVALYACDFLLFHWRMSRAKPGSPLETFTAPRLYAIAEKNGKVDYELDAQNPEQTITCAHSLFPHAGCSPCWYIKPRSQRPIPM